MKTVEVLDDLINELDAALRRQGGGGDAIDRVLGSPSRQTSVRRLRDEEAIVRFREELADGLIRVDTAGKVLDLVRQVLGVVLATKA